MRELSFPKANLQGIDGFRHQFAVEFQCGREADPSGGVHVRILQELRSPAGEQTVRSQTVLGQGQIEMPPRIIRSSQTQVRAYGECSDVGIRCADRLQQAQSRVIIAIFERQ